MLVEFSEVAVAVQFRSGRHAEDATLGDIGPVLGCGPLGREGFGAVVEIAEDFGERFAEAVVAIVN